MAPFLIYAHRGASASTPENTMAAFRSAYQEGADGIECDVRLTKDLIPVIFHDSHLDRTTNGTGPLAKITFKDLQKLDAGSWFHPSFSGEKVPSLKHFLSWVQKRPLFINLELKPSPDHKEILEKKALRLVHEYGLIDRTVISSYDVNSLLTLRRLDDRVKTALIYIYQTEPWAIARDVGASSLHPYYPFLTLDIYYESLSRGFEVIPYTVDNWVDLIDVMKLEPAGIITNYPQRIRKLFSLHRL
ncbi:conserved hypothetical protein [[Clostridium] ultunense Esp]|uniref:glycerophosphodiester phosphodiesterase n=1 Tax=Thermicanus aegyptius TaxID=94009 RepID=UPI0002B70C32|nr:glycerophosphodiester phosphodiesterase family protein [Thermicanus aegyptius]CCQ96196.1 conserved hypothetical protein [[Clostridium] ultunense Esp]